MKTLSRYEQIDNAITAIETRVTVLEGGAPPPPPPIDPPPPPPPPPPIPVDVNVYPLQMPSGVVDGAPVDLGTGPDILTLLMNGYGTQANTFVVLEQPSNRALTGPLPITSWTGEVGGQYFHIHGSWGPAPKEFKIVSGNIGDGLVGLWLIHADYNFSEMCYNGPTMDARGVPSGLNRTALWDNIGIPFVLSTEFLPVPPPPPPPPPPLPESIISGAIDLDGTMADGTLQELVNTAVEFLQLPAGNFIGTAAVSRAILIKGAGMGLTTITARGIRPTYDKGVFVPLVSGIMFLDMTITGAEVSAGLGGNAAAVRGEPNVSFTLRRVEVTGNQNGILTSSGNVTIETCYFHDNGNGNPGSGATHEVYLGAGDHVLSDSRFICGLLATHAVKSRGNSTTISDCELVGNGDDGTNGGAVLDVPNGGLLNVLRTSLEIKAGAANHSFLQYGGDNGANGAGPVTLLDVTPKGNGVAGIIETRVPGVDLTISGTYTGSPPDFRGWGTVTNTLVAA